MPIVTGNQGVEIPFTGDADKLVAESNRVIKELDEIKAHSKRMSEESLRHARVMEDAAKKQTSSWTEFRSMYSTVLDVVQVGQQVWEETGQKFVNNALEAGNLARMLGTTTEEASRLKEVAGDVGVGFDTLKTSMKIAQKDGFSPTIDGLAKMADEYNALAPGVERTQFLMDRFGKSGDEMAKILEKGSTSIREMSEAIDENLIVTEEAYKAAEEYRVVTDNLADSWDGLTMMWGQRTVPIANKLITAQLEGSAAIKEQETWIGKQTAAVSESFEAWKELLGMKEADTAATDEAVSTSIEAADAFESEAEQAKILAEETKLAEQAIKDMTDANKEHLTLVGTLSDRIASHREKEADLQKQYDDGKISLDEYKTKWQELADQQEAASRRMILNMLEQQLAIGGLDERESEYLLNKGLEWGIYSQSAVDAAKLAMDEVNNLTASLNSVPTEKVVSVYVNTYHQATGTPGAYGFSGNTTHAAGGSFEIPHSVGNEAFMMPGGHTASGGERVSITPQNEDVISDRSLKKMARYIVQAQAQAGG
jgi:hypothetical protein